MRGILQRRFAGQSLGGWLVLLVAIVIGRTIFDYQAAGKTNRAYLRNLLETKTMERTASRLVTSWKDAEAADDPAGVDWQDIKLHLAKCMVAEASTYLESGDPYLRKRANKSTPEVLATKFLGACGAID